MPPGELKKLRRGRSPAAISGVVMTAPSGWPLPAGLAIVTMSGTTACCSKAQNQRPSRA